VSSFIQVRLFLSVLAHMCLCVCVCVYDVRCVCVRARARVCMQRAGVRSVCARMHAGARALLSASMRSHVCLCVCNACQPGCRGLPSAQTTG